MNADPVYLHWCANTDRLMADVRRKMQADPSSITPLTTPQLNGKVLTQHGAVSTLVRMEGLFDTEHFLTNFFAHDESGNPYGEAVDAHEVLKEYFSEAKVILVSERKGLRFYITLQEAG
ncbi:MAG TPA: hypothetical protein VFO38_00450 [Candidatus Saccharimonadales bacterium]|nr:hypothetical protein [Candidatus Saccharimonadales bacterium]